MLEAKKNEFFEKIFAVYNQNLLRRKFSSFNVCGLEHLQNQTLPCLIYANHSSWWDGLAAFQISHHLKLDSYLIMEEKQLRKYQFFRKLGAFSVIREKPKEAFQSINYAVKILQEKHQRFLWIFPQGEILPNDYRPLKFYNGLAHIIKKTGNCAALPMAFRFEFLGKFKPEIFVKIGNSDVFSGQEFFEKKNLTEALAEKLTRKLDELKTDIIKNNLDKYQNLI